MAMLRPALFAALGGLGEGHGLMWKPWSRANVAENNGWEADSTSIIAEPMPDVAPRSYPGNRPWAEPGQSLSNIGPCGSKPYGSQTNWNKPEHGWGTEVTATYTAGDVIDVEWCVTSSADHGGSYSYRLCQDESITAKFINPDYTPNGQDHAELEDCFQRGILSCNDVPGQNCRVHPSCQAGWGCQQASSWFHCDPHMTLGGGSCLARSVGQCRGNGGLLRDRVKLPSNFASNHTLIGFRWDCQQTAQLWLHCADVKILQGNGQPAPPTPAPAPTPTPAPSPGPQCGVAEYDRRDCAFSGIDEAGCIAKNCCWKSSGVQGVPWCFYQGSSAPSPPTNQCDVSENQRQDCGFFGIDQNGCENKGCCWRESNSGAPWCYYGASSASFLQHAHKKAGGQCMRDICREVELHSLASLSLPHSNTRTQVCQKTQMPC